MADRSTTSVSFQLQPVSPKPGDEETSNLVYCKKRVKDVICHQFDASRHWETDTVTLVPGQGFDGFPLLCRRHFFSRMRGPIVAMLPKAPFCVQNFFLEALFLQPGREHCTATTLWCSMAKATVAVISRHEVSPQLARQCGSEEKQRVQANGSNLQVLLNKVRTLGCKSSLKRQTQGWLEGDR